MKTKLTISTLCDEARQFSERESRHSEATLFGVTDGKAVGTYIEHKFRGLLRAKYDYEFGNSARGTDLPGLKVDIKATGSLSRRVRTGPLGKRSLDWAIP